MRRFRRVSLCAWAMAALVWGPGCRVTKHNISGHIGEPDILQDGPISLDEGDILVTPDGEDLVTTFKVTAASSDALTLTGRCTMQPLTDAPELQSDPAEFSRDGLTATGTCRFPGGAAQFSGINPEMVVQVIEVKNEPRQLRLLSHTGLSRNLDYPVVEVLGPDTIDPSHNGILRILTYQSTSGKAAPGIPITVNLIQGDREWTAATALTDDKGQVLLEFPVEADSLENIQMEVLAGLPLGDVSTPKIMLRPMETGAHLLLTTDKPIYQPEQTIHMRVLALEGAHRLPMADEDTVFTVIDSKGRKVAKFTTTTNEFGIAAATMKLGRVIDLGTYRIQADVGYATTQKDVTISRYALPRFRVAIQTDRPYYLPSQTVTGTLSAEYFFGQKVANAAVTLRASTYVSGFEPFQELTLFTDEEGQATFSFELPDRFYGTEFLQGNALAILEAEVTDGAGHKEHAAKSLVVAPSDVMIFVVPENPRLAVGTENRFFVQTVTPTGSPLPCSVTLAQNGSQLAVGDTDENGIAMVTLSVPTPTMTLSAHAHCEGGSAADKTFSLGAPDASDQEGLLIMANKPAADAGDIVDVTILAPRAKDRVYLDVVGKGLPLLTTPIDISNGKGTYQLHVSPDMEGICELRVYYLGRSGVLVRNTRLLYVRPDDYLTVNLATDREQYRPGENAQLDISVTDETGQGVPAAVGLSVVDEAVFAISDFRPGLEKQFYEFEDQLKEPSYQIKGCSFRDVEQATEDQGAEAKANLYLAALANADVFYPVHLSLGNFQPGMALLDLKNIVQQHANSLADILDGKVDSAKEAEDLLAHIPLFDPWGQPYAARVWDSRGICLSSSGPDETKGTGDDLSPICAPFSYASGDHDDNSNYNSNSGASYDAGMGPDAGWSMDAGGSPGDGGTAAMPRLRKDFPETLYFDPAVITDQNGHATVDIPLADSITTWRVTAIANAASGGLGSTDHGILVFQPFFIEPDLPAYLLDNVEVSIPVAVYNYTSAPQDVTLQVRQDSWFTLLDGDTKTVTVPAQSQAAAVFPMRVLHVGHRSFHVEGFSADFADAVEKPILVRPNGKEFSKTCGGFLTTDHAASCQVAYPTQRVDGGDELLVKLYGGPSAHVLEGVDSMIREPFG